ncbi:MAG TPA: metallophosphoesterase [Puia sp.]|nr:metallophosphoesterase [Puia sp.]
MTGGGSSAAGMVKMDWVQMPGMPDIPLQDTAAQLAWLKGVLAGSKEQWKLVFGHHPVFSGGKTHGSTRELIERFKPLFDKYHVQVYFAGHDHDLQHLRGGPVDYIVTGAGGEPRPTGRIEQTIYSASMPAFSAVSLFGDSIRVRFVDSEGKVVYKMSRSYR